MLFLSGDEAVATAALDAKVNLGTGYPGTPSTEILEYFELLGGKAQWAPNEKVALEVGVGVAYAGARSLVTMKHVGLNVAADPLFTAAYTPIDGALIVVSADDPGMASSQNEQDNRRYAVAAGVPMLEPSDSQEAYDFLLRAIEISERWRMPVLLRLTTRICHTKTRVEKGRVPVPAPREGHYERNIAERVMTPAYARIAHRRLRENLKEIAAWNETSGLNQIVSGSSRLGIITSGISYQHVREAAPEASVLKLGLTYPLPAVLMSKFATGVDRCVVVEEGDPYLAEGARIQGIEVEDKPEQYRFGELTVNRVRRILERDTSPEAKPVPGKPPALCPGCGHRTVFTALNNLKAIVAGDIGCYGLGVMPPFEAMDTSLCMGASFGVGLGLRHSLPPQQAKRVVGVIGDSTFLHSGLTGLAEMVYNPPPTGYVMLILDNGITAMTGFQENPGTGRSLNHAKTNRIVIEDVVRAMGVKNVHVVDQTVDAKGFEELIRQSMERTDLTVIVARRTCLLASRFIKEWEKCELQ
jgi:indolepyruvate ferredoxin oxidoreductase alpha subunit